MKKILTLLALGFALSIGAVYAQPVPPSPELKKAYDTANDALKKAKDDATAAQAVVTKAKTDLDTANAAATKADAAVTAAQNDVKKAQDAINAAARPPAPPPAAPSGGSASKSSACLGQAAAQKLVSGTPPFNTFMQSCMSRP